MKRLLSLVFVILFAVASATPSFAHGGRHSRERTTSYTVCTIESCAKTGLHIHSDRNYFAHYYGDGHDYHTYCNFEDCVLTGYHEHDGTYCFGHAADCGHGCWQMGGGHR